MHISKKDLYILDIPTLKKICNKYNIDYNIYIELKNNNIKKIQGINHKEFIINDIIKYLLTKKIPKKTIYKLIIQNYDSLEYIDENMYIYYGQYKTTNKNILKLLKKITNNLFYFGAISQKLIKYYWKKNKLITYKEFAKLWLIEYNNGDIAYPELAYNQFMKLNNNKNEWFKYKQKITDNILLYLNIN